MQKTLLITGATDGIGLETAKLLVAQGHHVLLHGRNAQKLAAAQDMLSQIPGGGIIEPYQADLSHFEDVESLAKAVGDQHAKLDVLINNAGVYNTPNPMTKHGLDIRFVVNVIAPYLLTQRLLPRLTNTGRVINLSSAAQASVRPEALLGQIALSDSAAYAQSKLALTMWSRHMALALKDTGPAIIAVNPGSMLGSKMVKQAYGVAGADLGIGAEILTRAALSEEFKGASGQYFDNDSGRFAPPHADALDPQKAAHIVRLIEEILAGKGGG